MGNALVPEFAVSDWIASKRFYCDVLGFECSYERPDEGFAYLKLGGAELMIDQIGTGRTFGDGYLPTEHPFDQGLNVQIEVDDTAILLRSIAATGFTLYLPLEDKGDEEIGHRQFVFADPDGYLLRFYQSLGSRLR